MVALHALNGRWPGVTVNAGVIAGGTRPNVVPAECRVQLDLRAANGDAFDAARAEVDRLAATSPIDGVTARPPRAGSPPADGEDPRHRPAWPSWRSPSPASWLRADRCHATGGASDANTTAGLGVPTLDGLGPIGGDDHSADEWLDLASVVPRTTLLASLIARVGEAL